MNASSDRVERLKSFDDFYPMDSGVEAEGLLPDVNPRAPAAAGPEELKQVGWTKGLELAKGARRDGQ